MMLYLKQYPGLTTTGAEVFMQLESLPRSILFYHQYLQFLGGLGVIVLAIAVIPALGGGAAFVTTRCARACQ